MPRNNIDDPTPYAVFCLGKCGLVFLSEKQYEHQMWRPNEKWKCPSCGGPADWDDDSQVSS